MAGQPQPLTRPEAVPPEASPREAILGLQGRVNQDIIGQERVELLGYSWSMSGGSGLLLYLLGLGGEIFLLTSLYMVMPVGRLSLRHALVGGVTATLLWEVTRRVLVWYFSTLSQVNVVYGSLTTAIVVLLSLEIAATLVLFGAQVIAQYERLDREQPAPTP